jgi:hypothetical protein
VKTLGFLGFQDMTNAYEKAQQFGITGTDAQIVAALKATGVTASPISLAYLMEMLNLRGMLRKTDGSGGQERWVGTLQNLKAALVGLGMTAEVSAYEMWFSHVTNPRQSFWDTTRAEFAAGFWAMQTNFAGGPDMPSLADFAAVAALGGGWLYANLTAEQFAAQRVEVETAAQKQVVRSRLDTAWNQVGTSEQAEAIAEFRAIADELEAG